MKSSFLGIALCCVCLCVSPPPPVSDPPSCRLPDMDCAVLFVVASYQLVGEVQVEGGYRKPTWRDIFAVQLVLLPYHLCVWAKKKYRHHYQGDQVSTFLPPTLRRKRW